MRSWWNGDSKIMILVSLRSLSPRWDSLGEYLATAIAFQKLGANTKVQD